MSRHMSDHYLHYIFYYNLPIHISKPFVHRDCFLTLLEAFLWIRETKFLS